MSHRLRFTLPTLALVTGFLPGFVTGAEGGRIEGETFATVSVTVDPDEHGTIRVPSPFTILPGAQRVAIHVPESAGIFLLEGERILHHYPLPQEVDDLEATSAMLVAGQRHAAGQFTVTLDIFDLVTGQKVEHFASANPYLRMGVEGEDLWRAVVLDTRAGVYHPPAGASYPLWDRTTGVVPSSEQMARASAGIGFGGEVAWIPQIDGTISRRQRGRTTVFSGEDLGDFLDPVSDEAIVLLQPATDVRSDADGDLLLPQEIHVRLLTEGGAPRDASLASLGTSVRATRLVIHGRPVRVLDGNIYWIFVGHDFLEIRRAPVEALR